MRNRRTLFIGLLVGVFLLFGAGSPAQQTGWPRGGTDPEEKILASPLLVDLDNDGRTEVIVPSFDDNLYVYEHTGAPKSGWPKTLGFSDGSIGSVAVGDVDGDGNLDIVCAGDNALSQSAAIKVFETSGTLLGSITLNAVASAKATPCLVDCYRYDGPTEGDRHEAEEILIRDGDGLLHVVYWNGTGFSDHGDGSSTYTTVTDDHLKDRYGAQQISSSIAAVCDGTSQTEIVVGSTDNKVYRWRITSTTSTNWSISKLAAREVTDQSVRFYSSPALVDLDGDGDREIIVGGSDAWMYVWDGSSTGSCLAGWPQPTGRGIISSPAVTDVDGDSYLDIVAGSNDGKVYAWDMFGNLLPGWPVETNGDVFSSPAVADLDGASTGCEVVAASLDGYLYAWSFTGDLLAGWPKRMNTPLYSSPSVGNIHGGDRMSIVIGGYNGRVFVWDLSLRSQDTTAGWRQFRDNPSRTGTP